MFNGALDGAAGSADKERTADRFNMFAPDFVPTLTIAKGWQSDLSLASVP